MIKELKVFVLARTVTDYAAMDAWFKECGVSDAGRAGLADALGSVEDSAGLVSMAGKRCYLSFEAGLNPNITKVRRGIYDHIGNMIKAGHGSVLEHVSWTFGIEGLTRVAEIELVRHRVGTAFSFQSGRYCRFDDIPYWEPESIQPGSQMLRGKCPECKGKGGLCPRCQGSGFYYSCDVTFEERKALTRSAFAEGFTSAEQRYSSLCNLWNIDSMESGFALKKKLTSLFRRIVPLGHSTGGVVSLNARALRHIAAMRTHPSAEEEIALLLRTIGRLMIGSNPGIFGDFTDQNGVLTPKKWKV